MTLKDELRAALANTGSQSPIDTETLAKGHQRRRVEAALMEMYQDREVCCCQVTRHGTTTILWWCVGAVSAAADFYGVRGSKTTKAAKTGEGLPRLSTRIGDFSRNLLAHIRANAGGTTEAYCDQLKLRKPADRNRVSYSIYNLVKIGWLRAEGKNPGKRYYPTEAK